MLRFLTAGESHGKAVIAILEGMPSGLSITVEEIQKDLDRRNMGAGRGGRGLIETDRVEILSGVRHGKTLGSPIAILIPNLDHKNWSKQMNQQSDDNIPISNPRPGHADLPGTLKYGFKDVRNVIERASARETAARVAVGAVVRKLLFEFNIHITSHTLAIGKISINSNSSSFADIVRLANNNPVTRCVDINTAKLMQEEILLATKNKDTLGGIIEVLAHGVPPGLGSYVHFDRKLDAKIAFNLMSVPSVKAVELGMGINNASKYGSQVQDEIFQKKGKIFRHTNRSGGLEGGVTNGEDIICRVFLKPISTLGKPLHTVDIITRQETKALTERSDICVVPRAGIVCESMLILALAESFLEKFGQDNLDDLKNNLSNYKKSREIS